MKRLVLTLCALTMVCGLLAQTPRWQDPNYIEKNRLPMRSSFIVGLSAGTIQCTDSIKHVYKAEGYY